MSLHESLDALVLGERPQELEEDLLRHAAVLRVSFKHEVLHEFAD